MTDSKIVLVEQTHVPQVAPGTIVLYAQDGRVYLKDDSQQSGIVSSTTSMADIGARAYNNAVVSIGTASWTVVTLNSEAYDTNGFHSTTTNTGRMTVPSGFSGKYLIVFNAAFAAGAAVGTKRGIRLYLNGNIALASQESDPISAWAASISTIRSLSEGDYVEGYAYQDSGGDLNLAYTAELSPYLTIQRVG